MEIKFDNVSYLENNNTPLKKTYLRNVSFNINEGINTFLGDSKSGKEKIPDLINFVKSPTSGIVKVDKYTNNGKFIKGINRIRINVGYSKMIPEDILFNKTVKEELSFGLKNFKYKLNKEEIRVKEALTLVGLNEEYLNKKISELNISEKKKVSIASTLIFNPKIIILEEPLMFLNSKDKENIKKLIKMLKNKYNKTIIILTNDASLSYELSDKIYILNKGKIVMEGDKNIAISLEILKYNIDLPEIIKFINLANLKGANLTNTSNILDLIKEVYRNV